MKLTFQYQGLFNTRGGDDACLLTAPQNSMQKWSGFGDRPSQINIWSGEGCIKLERDHSFALLRGYFAGNPSADRKHQIHQLDKLLTRFCNRDPLELHRLDGSFTVLLTCAKTNRLTLFRNLVGSTFSYYRETERGLEFGSNLAALAKSGTSQPKLNAEVLPSYFLYRFTPGNETLFEGINRLGPGECLLYENQTLRVDQIQTYEDLSQTDTTNEIDATDRVEAAMSDITRDHLALYETASGMLSGGVDSSYIQAHWNQAWQRNHTDQQPRSAAFWLNQRLTDRDYTLSAVEEFQTDHTSVQLENLTLETIQQTLRETGEMPNHVQSFYFSTLAKEMKKRGSAAGLCGEGADGLFGNTDILFVANAHRQARQIPSRLLRYAAASAAQIIGRPYRAATLRLANHLDDLNWFQHPINTNGAFTDWKSVTKCFGQPAVLTAIQNRQQLLSAARVPDDPLHFQRILTIGYLGEAVNTSAFWSMRFNAEGVDMLCPFLDSRMLRASASIDPAVKFGSPQTKVILKKALRRHVPDIFVNRPKRGFGQPIMEWMSPGGQLRPAVEDIEAYDFISPSVVQQAKEMPNWFLYNLLLFDIWHKEFFS